MSFWSKIFKSETSSTSSKTGEFVKTSLSSEEKEKTRVEISKLNEQLKEEELTGSKQTDINKQKADILTKLGQSYQKLNEVDKAIDAYEKSLQYNEDFGPAFDGLIKLYDVKRQAAAYAKDNEAIQKWLNKSDELTTLSKKIMRSK